MKNIKIRDILFFLTIIIILIFIEVDKYDTKHDKKRTYEIINGSPSWGAKSVIDVKISLKEGALLNNSELYSIAWKILFDYKMKKIEYLFINYYLPEMELNEKPYATFGRVEHYRYFNGKKTLVIEPEVKLFKKSLIGSKYEKLIHKCNECKWSD